ncbi:MAG TPA: hypothetical protein VKB84_12290 [Candidatus Binataceae bacterium]|nr:hypothetical protein [Candidatus Binataceae bacterium]
MDTCEYCGKDKEDALIRFYTHPETHRNTFLTLCEDCENKLRYTDWGQGEAGGWLKQHLIS